MADMMYRLILRAQFEDASELDRVTSGLQQLQVQGAQVSVNMGQMGASSSYSLQGMARSAMSVGFIFNMMESAIMRQEVATRQLNQAQQDLTATVKKYGVGSIQATEAATRLKEQQDYLTQANMRQYVAEGLMIGNLIIQSGLLKANALEHLGLAAAKIHDTVATASHSAALGINNVSEEVSSALHKNSIVEYLSLTASKITDAAATWVETAALNAKNVALAITDALSGQWWLLGAAAVAGIGIGAYEINQSTQKPTSTINNSTSNTVNTAYSNQELSSMITNNQPVTTQQPTSININTQVSVNGQNLNTALEKQNAQIKNEVKRATP